VTQCEDRPELGGFGHGDELVACAKGNDVHADCSTVVGTVPFHSIRQSRVTEPPKMLKCHGCHGVFQGVPNSFMI
jgi:hypothetical protein